MLTPQEIARYSKQLLLEDIGFEGQQLLRQGKVLVIGAGGLGCPVLQYLNAAGVGTIGIAEFDVVDATNLHRQILYGPSAIGRKKAVVAVEQLAAQNPFTAFQIHDCVVTEANIRAILDHYDLVVDGCDNFETRYIVNDAAVALGKPLVYGSILGYQGQVSVFARNGSRQLRDIFPEAPDAAEVPSCANNGVLGTVPGIIGTIMAQAVISILLGRPSFENQFLLFDTLTMERTVLAL